MIRVIAILFASLVLSFVISYSLAKYIFNPSVNKEKTQAYVLPTLFPTIGAQTSVSPTKIITSLKDIIPSKSPAAKSKPTPTTFLTPPASPTPTRGVSSLVKLMPLGDSITDGAVVYGGYRTPLWKMLMADGDKIDFVGSATSGSSDLGDWNHEGHIGWETGQLAPHVSAWITAAQPDIVLIHTGTNDLDHGNSPEVMTQRLSALLGNIFVAKPDTYVIVSTIVVAPKADGTAWAKYNAAIPGVVASYRSQGRKIVSIDMSNILTPDDILDGLHPNATGYNKMANAWYPVVSTIYREYAGTLH